jgi:hypothetical protein
MPAAMISAFCQPWSPPPSSTVLVVVTGAGCGTVWAGGSGENGLLCASAPAGAISARTTSSDETRRSIGEHPATD